MSDENTLLQADLKEAITTEQLHAVKTALTAIGFHVNENLAEGELIVTPGDIQLSDDYQDLSSKEIIAKVRNEHSLGHPNTETESDSETSEDVEAPDIEPDEEPEEDEDGDQEPGDAAEPEKPGTETGDTTDEDEDIPDEDDDPADTEESKSNTAECQYCGRECDPRGVHRHEMHCDENPGEDVQDDEDDDDDTTDESTTQGSRIEECAKRLKEAMAGNGWMSKSEILDAVSTDGMRYRATSMWTLARNKSPSFIEAIEDRRDPEDGRRRQYRLLEDVAEPASSADTGEDGDPGKNRRGTRQATTEAVNPA